MLTRLDIYIVRCCSAVIRKTDELIQDFPAPLEDVIGYEIVTFKSSFDNETTPYQAPPSPEIDALWEDLYNGKIHLGFYYHLANLN